MSSPFARLVVELAASTAKFQTDLAKAVAQAESASKRIGLAMDFVKRSVISIGGVVSVGAFIGLIKGSIDAADHLNDLSKATGVAVETLGGIGFAAQQSGSDLDGAAKAFGKLNLKIAEAIAGNEEAGRVFRTLGISLTELKNSSPDQVFAKVADRFAEWEDGANKARIGQALFSKEYQAIIPLLDEGGAKLRQNIEYYKRFGTVTAEFAGKADEFNDTMVKLKLLNSSFANTLAAELLPNLQALADHLVDSKEKGGAFRDTARDVAAVIKATAAAAGIGAGLFHVLGTNIGAAAAALVAFASLDFSQAARIVDEVAADNEKAIGDARALVQALLGEGVAKGVKQGNQEPPRKKPAPSFGSDDADAAYKKALDGRIADLDRYIKSENETLKDREAFLQDYYQADELGLTDFFDRRRAVLAEAAQNTVRALNREIEEYRAAELRLPKAADREELEAKIRKAIDARTDAERQASVETYRSFREQKKAAQAFADSIEEIAIRLADLNGDTVGSALAQFDLQNRSLRKQIDLNKQSTDDDTRRQADLADRLLANLRERNAQQAQLNFAQRAFGRVADEVSISQERLSLARSSGQITEIDYLQQLSAANKARIPELEAQAGAYLRVAQAANDPDALIQAQRLQLQIEQLGAQTDLLADKFRGTFHDALGDAIAEFADGTKTFSQAVKDMERSIVSSISKIASQNIADSLFGKSGPLGGIGGIFASIFGGTGAGGNAGPAALGAATAAAVPPLTAFTSAVSAATAALATMAGSSAAGSLVSPGFGAFGGLDFGGFFAAGGSPPVGRASIVGERGPELFVPRSAGTIIPNEVLTARRAQRQFVQHVNFYVQGAVNTQTQDQMAAKMYQATVRARRIL